MRRVGPKHGSKFGDGGSHGLTSARPAKRRCSSAVPMPASQSAAASDGSAQRRLTAPVGPSKSKSRFGL